MSEFEGQHAATPGLVKGALSGVGDDALYVSLGNLVTLYVKKGASVFAIRMYGVPDPEAQKSMEKALALDVLTKLGAQEGT